MNEINPYSDIPHFVYDLMSLDLMIPSSVYENGPPILSRITQMFRIFREASKTLCYLFDWMKEDVSESRQ